MVGEDVALLLDHRLRPAGDDEQGEVDGLGLALAQADALELADEINKRFAVAAGFVATAGIERCVERQATALAVVVETAKPAAADGSLTRRGRTRSR